MISQLLVAGLIFLITNTVLTPIISALSFLAAVLSGVLNATPGTLNRTFLLTAFVVCLALFLFSVTYGVVSVIGSILGLLHRDSIRKIGFVMLILINIALIPFFVANITIVVVWFYSIDGFEYSYFIIPCLGIAIGCCQCCMFVYSIIHIVVIGLNINFRKRLTYEEIKD